VVWFSPSILDVVVLRDEKRHRRGMRNAPSVDEHRVTLTSYQSYHRRWSRLGNPVGIGQCGDGIL
jgi:hypothetical protein